AAFEAVQPLPLAAQQLSSSLAAAQRLFTVANQKDSSPPHEQQRPLPDATPPHLTIKNLTFTYPASTTATDSAVPPFALHDFSLDLPPGKKIAIIGPSGAGKSTLVNLLLR
ncbi:MAG: ATP-binding cassette domain-containing protein, partial [Anaerolineales bacterium]|nr:ATP-binding cassette domain-containing protein [Anaerolineales bacterium]